MYFRAVFSSTNKLLIRSVFCGVFLRISVTFRSSTHRVDAPTKKGNKICTTPQIRAPDSLIISNAKGPITQCNFACNLSHNGTEVLIARQVTRIILQRVT